MSTWFSRLLRKEWFLGALGGIVATGIGFLLAMTWDIYKLRTEGHEREQATLGAIAEEMKANQEAIDRNINILAGELEVLKQGRRVVKPLSLLQTSAWDLVKISRPGRLFVPNTIVKLREIVTLAGQLNEEIRSRESYRIYNGAMNNYLEVLRLYDENLLAAHNQLRASLKAYEAAAVQK